MLEFFRQLTISQYKAALQTIENCVEESPEDQWTGKVVNHSFSGSAFHAIFFADLYLGNSLDDFKAQSFHLEHASEFEGYEELEDKIPEKTYTKQFIKEYLDFCRHKVERILHEETETSLESVSGIPWQEITRGELHIYNIRHLQHHAAQLIMRLRLDSDVDSGWVRAG